MADASFQFWRKPTTTWKFSLDWIFIPGIEHLLLICFCNLRYLFDQIMQKCKQQSQWNVIDILLSILWNCCLVFLCIQSLSSIGMNLYIQMSSVSELLPTWAEPCPWMNGTRSRRTILATRQKTPSLARSLINYAEDLIAVCEQVFYILTIVLICSFL